MEREDPSFNPGAVKRIFFFFFDLLLHFSKKDMLQHKLVKGMRLIEPDKIQVAIIRQQGRSNGRINGNEEMKGLRRNGMNGDAISTDQITSGEKGIVEEEKKPEVEV